MPLDCDLCNHMSAIFLKHNIRKENNYCRISFVKLFSHRWDQMVRSWRCLSCSSKHDIPHPRVITGSNPRCYTPHPSPDWRQNNRASPTLCARSSAKLINKLSRQQMFCRTTNDNSCYLIEITMPEWTCLCLNIFGCDRTMFVWCACQNNRRTVVCVSLISFASHPVA